MCVHILIHIKLISRFVIVIFHFTCISFITWNTCTRKQVIISTNWIHCAYYCIFIKKENHRTFHFSFNILILFFFLFQNKSNFSGVIDIWLKWKRRTVVWNWAENIGIRIKVSGKIERSIADIYWTNSGPVLGLFSGTVWAPPTETL